MARKQNAGCRRVNELREFGEYELSWLQRVVWVGEMVIGVREYEYQGGQAEASETETLRTRRRCRSPGLRDFFLGAYSKDATKAKKIISDCRASGTKSPKLQQGMVYDLSQFDGRGC